MALNWSTGAIFNPNNDFFETIDLDRQAANQANIKGYSSDFVVEQLWWLWKIPITFDWTLYHSTPEYLWLTGMNIPSDISWLPNSLWYMRSAAYSIAESYGQLQSLPETSLSNDQIKEMIIKRVIELFQEEIARIQSYLDQENVILMPDLLKKFERHLGALEYYMNVYSQNLWTLATQNVRQDRKWVYEEIMLAA